MSSSPAVVQQAPGNSASFQSSSNRWVYYLLAFLALTYAFFAGLRTVSDFDLGWQMATGRWIVQHRSIPSIDVLSYTAAGQPWIYPVGAGLVFYAAYALGGFALLSWVGAAVCVGSLALLLRRNSSVGGALAILAVPVIAQRTTPRADMFTVLLFAASLSLLWEQHRTGNACLWLMPLLMLAWVNLHLGFVAGLGLVAAYAVVELLDAAFAARRRDAFDRLRRAAPWLGAAVLATLLNPWGWGIYRALIVQQRVNSQHEYLIAEWTRLPLTWTALLNSLSLRQTEGAIYMLLAIAFLAAMVAIFRADWGAALMLLGASYAGARYMRMGALFACVVVVVSGPMLGEAAQKLVSEMKSPRMRSSIVPVAVALLALLVAARCFDLATNRFYLRGSSESTFGAGLSWWFPERAATFISTRYLPGELFNAYDAGGYVAWRLGPERRNSIDGRAPVFGVAAIRNNSKLLQTSPDSPLWKQEADRYGINTILLPLARFDGIELTKVLEFCNSTAWRPVYIDEVSAVLVPVLRPAGNWDGRPSPSAVNCATAPIPPNPPRNAGAEAFNTWANSAAVLAALGRTSEALAATDSALGIFPDSSFAHWLRGNLLSATNRPDEAREEYVTAVRLESSDVTWAALADFDRTHGRMADAIDAMQRAAALSRRPYSLQQKLGYLYLKANRPQDALRALDQAEHSAPAKVAAADQGTFDFMLAQGRSVAWSQLGDASRAIAFQEKATQLQPDASEPWRRLAKLYRTAGRNEDALRAELTANAAEQKAQN
jgi:tetratricopeptide (TPR) repeat protein